VHRDLGIQATGFPESHHPHQDIRVIALDEGRIDAQLPCRIIRKPSTRERLPRFVHPLDGEVPEIGLEQLPPVRRPFLDMGLKVALTRLSTTPWGFLFSSTNCKTIRMNVNQQ